MTARVRTKEKPILAMGKIGDARLDLVPSLDGLVPGLQPLEYNVIVAPAKMPEQIGRIIIPDSTQETMELAMQVGRIVAVSPIAFNYDKWPEGSAPPGRGDIVWFARYGGGEFQGLDGRTYRLLKDKDIGAVVIVPEGYTPPVQALEGAAVALPESVTKALKAGPGLARLQGVRDGEA